MAWIFLVMAAFNAASVALVDITLEEPLEEEIWGNSGQVSLTPIPTRLYA